MRNLFIGDLIVRLRLMTMRLLIGAFLGLIGANAALACGTGQTLTMDATTKTLDVSGECQGIRYGLYDRTGIDTNTFFPITDSNGALTIATQTFTDPASGAVIKIDPVTASFGLDFLTYRVDLQTPPSTSAPSNFNITLYYTAGSPYISDTPYTITIKLNPNTPVANAVSATVAANSTSNAVSLSITGTATSVAVTSAAVHGTTTTSGTSITYTPNAGYIGSDIFRYTATNGSGTSSPATVNVTVSAPTIVVSPSSLPGATAGASYSQSLSASGGSSPYTFNLSAGSLPAGMSLSSSGTLSGTPTVVGSSNFSISVNDSSTGSGPASGARAFTFAVTAAVPDAPTIGIAAAGDTQANVSFTAPTNTGGAAITGYTVTSSPGGNTGAGAASPIIVTGLTNGVSYTFTVTATTGAGTGAASAASGSVTPQAAQTITFGNPGAQIYGTTPSLTATATSSLGVSFTSSTTGVCSVTTTGDLTFAAPGSCTIDADQAGNTAYLAAPTISQTFAVTAAVPDAPTIGIAAFTSPTNGIYSAEITLSEASVNFDLGDLTLTNATAKLSGSGASYTALLTPIADGEVKLSVVAGVFTDVAGNANAASNEVSATFATSVPDTPTEPSLIANADGRATVSGIADPGITVRVTFPDGSMQAVIADMTTGAFSVTSATAQKSGTILIVAIDANGKVSPPNALYFETDTEAPTVSISGAPASADLGGSFNLTVTFSEDVTGFTAGDITASNAIVAGLSGSGAIYTVTLTASASGGVITVMVPADVVIDAVGLGNLASNSVAIADKVVATTQGLAASFMQTRANQLLANQPSLTPFLSGQSHGSFDAEVSRGATSFSIATGADRPIWMSANGSWTSDNDSDSRYIFGAIGSHMTISDSVLLGAMLQFDHLSETTDMASVKGTGWMVGPYFVAKSENHPLYFEGRLLHGQTRNTISPFGTYEDDFDTNRMLAQVKVAGEVIRGATTYSPFLDASYTTDDQKAYVDSLGNVIPKQGITLTQLEGGVDFSTMIPVPSGELELRGGISGIWSQTSGSGYASTVTPDYEGGRGRVEIGFRRMLSPLHSYTMSAQYDGIGARGYESFGLSANYELKF